jgi:hypothetical protein
LRQGGLAPRGGEGGPFLAKETKVCWTYRKEKPRSRLANPSTDVGGAARTYIPPGIPTPPRVVRRHSKGDSSHTRDSGRVSSLAQPPTYLECQCRAAAENEVAALELELALLVLRVLTEVPQAPALARVRHIHTSCQTHCGRDAGVEMAVAPTRAQGKTFSHLTCGGHGRMWSVHVDTTDHAIAKPCLSFALCGGAYA